MIVKIIVDQQHRYYLENNSYKTRNRWGIQLITKLCTIIQNHWIHRNLILHETEELAKLSGVEKLKSAILKEYELGLGELPSVYTSYF